VATILMGSRVFLNSIEFVSWLSELELHLFLKSALAEISCISAINIT
jgi:hypothetical protein